jgi:hypothetical protein
MNQTPKEILIAKLMAMSPRARIAVLEMASRKREEEPPEQKPDDYALGPALE